MRRDGDIPDEEPEGAMSGTDTAEEADSEHGDKKNFHASWGKSSKDLEEQLQTVFQIVNAETGHDFSPYKASTVMRRIERRMAMNGINGIDSYVARLRESSEESRALCREFLIGVTSFFRDPEAFAALREQVVQRIFTDRDRDDPVRVWDACCATGEEAYSTAIMLREYMQEQGLDFKVQIFATDIDAAALDTARCGLYPAGIVADVGERRLNTFFTRTGDNYRVAKELRDMVVFARHNLIKDPPYSRLDLLVCRNFLIYLNLQMQQRIIPLFHHALKRDGVLFLGSSETLGNRSDMFSCADKKWNIFIRREDGRGGEKSFPVNPVSWSSPGTGLAAPSHGKADPNLKDFVEKMLMERYFPPCVVVDERYETVHFSTRSGGLLEPPVGEPTRNILKMAREELRPPLRAAIHKVIATGERVAIRGVKVVVEGREARINVLVEPVIFPSSERKLAMVVFEPAPLPTPSLAAPTDGESLPESEISSNGQLIRQLEEQLRVTQEQLLATIDQLEASNEGLMAANEELMSNNEEFQTTNEELQTANEELEASKEELRRAKEEWERTFDSVPDLIAILDNRHRVVRVNRAMAERLARKPEECAGLPCYAAVHGTEEPPEFCPHALTMADGWEHAAEVHEERLGGDFFVSTTPLADPSGRITGTVHVARDITARKQVEEALRESEKRYRLLFENMMHGFAYCRMIFDESGLPADFVYLEVNKAFEILTGLGDVTGKRVTEVIPGVKEAHPELFEIYGRVASTGKPEKFEIEFAPLKVWFSISVYCPEKGCFVAVFDDITERKQAEEEREMAVDFLRMVNESRNKDEIIRSAATFFQQRSGCEAVGIRLKEGYDYPYFETRGFPSDFVLMENSLCDNDVEGYPILDGAGNPVIECMCGNVILGRFDPAKPFFTEQGSFWTNCTTELLAGTSDEDRMTRTRNRCNGEGYESVALIPLRFGEERLGLLQLNDRRKGRFTPAGIALWERLAGYLSVALAKFRAEEALLEKEERWQFAIEGSNDGVWDRNIRTGEVFFSRRWKEMLGFSEDEVGNGVDDWMSRIHRGDLPLVKTELEKHFRGVTPYYSAEYRMWCKDGSFKWILARGKVIARAEDGRPLRFVGTHTDMTERKNLEAQLYQAQKMEAVGQLAGGVAHDFNNILTAIIGFSHLILMKTAEDDPLRHYVGQIRAAAEKAADLTQGLLTFSRKQVMVPRVVDLNETVTNLEKMLRRLISEDIELSINTHVGQLNVMADRGKLEQVLMNLATNAKDAMPKGRTLSITTSSVTLNGRYPHPFGLGAVENCACISVGDTGCGMDDETRKRIFEPFFTTKEVGKGTGLGLSIVYGIVKHHNGYIDVFSEPGKGTIFNICLPLAEVRNPEPPMGERTAPTGGTETILLAEGDPAVRDFHRTLLEEWGYTVIEAADGEEAMDKFAEYDAGIDLLVFDMVMPKMSGRDAYEFIRKTRPGVKVIFLSGYSADYLKDSAIVRKNESFLSKPVDPDELLNKVRKALGETLTRS